MQNSNIPIFTNKTAYPHLAFIFLSFLISIQSEFTFIRTYKPTIGGVQAYVYTYDTIGTSHFSVIMIDNTYSSYSMSLV